MTRAQEAEENYLVKRELATVKQQSEEVSTQLEQAQSTIRELQQQLQPSAVRTVHRQRPLLDWRTASEPAVHRKARIHYVEIIQSSFLTCCCMLHSLI